MKKILSLILILMMIWTVVDKYTYGNGSNIFPLISMYILEDEQGNRETIFHENHTLIIGDKLIREQKGITRIR